jgi:hypothetical protein
MSENRFTPAFLLKKRADESPEETNTSSSSRESDAPKIINLPDPPPEFSIPTLDTIAMPDEDDRDFDFGMFDPVLIGPEEQSMNLGGRTLEPQLGADDIRRITEALRATLLPEIEKAVSYAMNHAFALAMDQASHVLRQKVQSKVNELLPKLIEDAIKNPLRKP